MMVSEPQAKSSLDRGLHTASILVVVFAASVVLFGAVGSFLAAGDRGPTPAALPMAIISAAFFALVGSVAYRRVNFQPIRLHHLLEATGEGGLANHLVRTTVVSAALAESVGLFGLVLGLVTGDTYYLYALCAIALLGVLSNYPRADRWRDLLARVRQM
jgi:F0F1-type ATP synthase membrane subunit c/vacuolar-type H+-ATPase subunit K